MSEKTKEIRKTKNNNIIKISEYLSNPVIKYGFISIILIILGFISQYFLNKPNFGTFLSSDMDLSNNVYILGVDENKDEYKITKISDTGATKFQIKLEKSDNKHEYNYRNLEADSKGNIYIVKQQKDLEAVVADKTLYPSLYEKVIMYDNNGNYIKEVATIDFSNDPTPPVTPYIRKLQIVDQNLIIIARDGNYYDIISASPLLDEAPRKIKSFEIKPEGAVTSQEYQWVSDMSVLSTGRIFYSTLNGKLFGTNNNGEFEDFSSVMPTGNFIITDMSVDSDDNLYFTDTVSGKFYKLNTKSISLQNLYNLDSQLGTPNNETLRDIKNIKSLDTGEFFGESKSYKKSFYVRFGANSSYLVGDLRGSFFPWGFIIMIFTIILVLLIFYVIKYLAKLELKRIPLVFRILSMFLPVFVISMIVLTFVNTTDGVSEYLDLLRSEQKRGAKTAADLISGDDFEALNHVSSYMNSDYLKLKNSINKSTGEIFNKIGDRSDYIVTYIENYGNLYSSINTKYDLNSGSYNRLKYTNPDMVPNCYSIIDNILERTEVEKIYNIWNKFKNVNNTEEYIVEKFDDVYGSLTAAFAPIKDSNNRVVGIVGNFLDEHTHNNREFWKILQHSAALILVITVLLTIYICFVIKWALRPLKTIENSIKELETGDSWDTRIVVKSKDELADIAEAFNLMSEKIERYTSNLIRLNKEYIRYIPDKLFKLIDKSKITQVNLYDNKFSFMNMIYVSFNISCYDQFNFESQNEVFDEINKCYEKLFQTIEEHQGIVHSFDGLSLLALFPDDTNCAFDASLEFKDLDIHENIKEKMHILVGAGDSLIGISGDPERRGVILISDELIQLFNMDIKLTVLGIRHIVTENIVKNIKKSDNISYRYIGRAENSNGIGFTNIYQIIESDNKYRKDLYVSTMELFETGVKLYLDSRFEDARKIFAQVIRTNANDKVSMRYLMLCDEEINKINQIGVTKNFTGYLI